MLARIIAAIRRASEQKPEPIRRRAHPSEAGRRSISGKLSVTPLKKNRAQALAHSIFRILEVILSRFRAVGLGFILMGEA